MSDINPQGTEMTPLIDRHTEASHNEPPPRTHADGVIQPRRGDEVKDAPVDSVDGVIERDEVITPGVGDTYIVKNQPLALQVPRNERKKEKRSRDETDSELIRVKEDEKEPSYSFSPSITEEMEDAPLNLGEGVVQPCCFLLRSSYLRKRCEVLFYAVDYEPERVEEILELEESSTLIELFTIPDINGLPCVLKAISRQSLPCIEPLLKKLQELDFSHNIDKMDALQTHNKKKENIFHIAAQMVKKEEIINIICNYRMMDELADRPDSNGRTPLIVACQHKNHLMARKLVLEKKAKIDHVDNNKKSPIYLATITGSVQMLKYFLEEGERDTKDQLELFKKCELYHGTILQAIVESRCPGTLKVCLEVHNGREHIVQCLEQERKSNRILEQKRKSNFIHTVCQTPLVELVKLAIEGTEQVLEIQDDDKATPLIKAVEARQLEMVKLILSTKTGQKTISFQKKSTKETALMIACQKGFHKIVQFIMEISNIDINLGLCDTNSRNVFHHAAKDEAILSVMIDICRQEEKYQNYKEYLTNEDKNGYAPLHYAASHGACKNVTLLLENNVPYNTLSARVQRTALHYASCSNIDTVSALLEYVEKHFSKDELKDFIDKGDCRLQTSLHIASALGKRETALLLLQKGATIKFDKDNETPLHMACNTGCIKTVELLIQHDQTVINSENRVGETPAMFAAVSGQTEMLEFLLAKNANLWAESHRAGESKTCLDWAVLGGKPETVKAILEHAKWKKTMEKSVFGADGLLGKMVISMPSVAIEVLNKCARAPETEKAHEIELAHEIEYDFFALQTTESSSVKVTDMKALEAMVNYSRNECLSHPVVEKFLQQKWSLRTRFCYIFCLMIYTLFLIFFTAYITLVTEGRSDHSCSIIKMICYVLAIMSVVKELFQLYHRRLQYFCMESTYLELVMYICVFVYLPRDEKSNVQRQAGAVAIFLGWINFTWFLKRFQTYGIYIIMAKKIFVTFIKVFVPVSFFIIAFSMTFFVLFHDSSEQHGFDNIFRSFVTAFAMMAGDMDYRETFLGQDVLVMLFVVLFLALMSILLMNLLTGLAVGDIGMIMRRSIAEKQIQQAKLIVEMDKCLKTYPGLGAKYIEPLKVQHKRNSCYKTCLQKLKKKLFPSLDMDDDTERKKQQECEIVKIKRQLNVVQNTLEEIQRSLKKNQPTTLNKRERAFSLVSFARNRLGTL